VRHMISFLAENLDITKEQAYMLCSVIGELRIHEVVDKPNWVVGMMVPRNLIKENKEPRKKRA